jgi:glycosyltransferase involved in cell wall biosynthesis
MTITGKKNHKVAYIIPTKDRPKDLRRLLNSLAMQTRPIDQIIVVDGSDNEISQVIGEYKQLKIDYVRTRPPGLTRQRNAGIRALRPEITLAGYLDDDLVLEGEATEKMLEFWNNASAEVGGASFNVVNNIPNRLNWFTKLFGMNQGRQGVILTSGFCTVLYPVNGDTRVEWLCGGATVWKKEVVDEFKYDEWFLGCSYYEDLDYSFRVNQKYVLMVSANAKVRHLTVPIEGEKAYHLAKANLINRFYLIKKYPYYSSFAFYWATLGQLLANLGFSVIKRNRDNWLRAKGIVSGIWCIISGNIKKRDFKK